MADEQVPQTPPDEAAIPAPVDAPVPETEHAVMPPLETQAAVAPPETAVVSGPDLASLEAEETQLEAVVAELKAAEAQSPASDGAAAKVAYRVTSELSWTDPATGKPVVALPGETRTDLLPQSIPWLLDQGHISRA